MTEDEMAGWHHRLDGCESWTVKEAECRRIPGYLHRYSSFWSFKEVEHSTPLFKCEAYWTARRSNQSILKEINPEYSLEGLMMKLKLQYFSHL